VEDKTTKKGFEVPSLEMLNRYIDLKHFMMEELEIYYKHILSTLLKNNSLSQMYEREKEYFKTDKELGLYWLIIFGLLEDKRYGEVLKNISHFDWDMITEAKSYFNTKEYYKIVNAVEKMTFLSGCKIK